MFIGDCIGCILFSFQDSMLTLQGSLILSCASEVRGMTATSTIFDSCAGIEVNFDRNVWLSELRSILLCLRIHCLHRWKPFGSKVSMILGRSAGRAASVCQQLFSVLSTG